MRSKAPLNNDDVDLYLPLGTPVESMRARIAALPDAPELGRLSRALRRLERFDATVDEVSDEYRACAGG